MSGNFFFFILLIIFLKIYPEPSSLLPPHTIPLGRPSALETFYLLRMVKEPEGPVLNFTKINRH